MNDLTETPTGELQVTETGKGLRFTPDSHHFLEYLTPYMFDNYGPLAELEVWRGEDRLATLSTRWVGTHGSSPRLANASGGALPEFLQSAGEAWGMFRDRPNTVLARLWASDLGPGDIIKVSWNEKEPMEGKSRDLRFWV